MILLSLLIAIIWGSKSIGLNLIMKNYSSEFIYSLQIILEILFILLFIGINNEVIYNDINKFTFNDFIAVFFVALIGTFFSNYLFTHLLKYNDPSIVTVIAYSAPIFTVIISTCFLKREINMIKQIGILLSFIGVVMVSL